MAGVTVTPSSKYPKTRVSFLFSCNMAEKMPSNKQRKCNIYSTEIMAYDI